MARDYQKKPTARHSRAATRRKSPAKSSSGMPGWLLMLGGFVPGVFLAVLVHLHHVGSGSSVASTTDVITRDAATAGGQDDDARPRFEFYKLLSEMEVVVPDEPEEFTRRGSNATPPPPPTTARVERTPTPAPIAPATRPPEDGMQYLVQAGSFRNQTDADRLKARLALMGVESQIQSVQHAGSTWHRVRIGPLASRSRVDDVRQRLKEEDVDSILLRVQG